MATTKEADLITAVLLYAIRCLGEADQSALRAHCLRIDLNREVFWYMVEHIKQLRASEEVQQTMIKADAPQEMMQALFGLSAKEYTRRRRLMTLEPAVGRPAEPGEDKEHALWKAWKARVKGEDVELLTAEDYLALKADTDVELRVIWLLTRRWAQYGNPEGLPHG